MKAEQFIGLSKVRAQDVCEANNMIFRLIRSDNETFFDYPIESDKRTDRICVELENGRIIKATIT